MFHVKGVKVLARNEIRMCGAVRQIVYIFIYFGPIFVAAIEITLGL